MCAEAKSYIHFLISEQKRKSTTLGQHSFQVLPKKSRNDVNTQLKKEREKEVEQGLKQRIFACVNNGGHADQFVMDPNFREIIDYTIKNATYLTNYKHLGVRGYVSIQCISFKAFLDFVSGLINEIRQWYIDNTVSFEVETTHIC
jgi:hypothetical protein